MSDLTERYSFVLELRDLPEDVREEKIETMMDYDHREGNCEEDECNEDKHRRDCEERIRARFPVYF